MSKFLLCQTAVGDYRQSVINKLEAIFGDDLIICTGDVYFDKTTKTRVNFKSKIVKLRNYYLFENKCLLQVGATWKAILSDNVVLEMNPRILNTWFIALIRRLLFKPVVMWGHAWPRRGKESSTDRIRSRLRSLATVIIVYTETQKCELLVKEPNRNVIVAPNSLYPVDLMHYDSVKKRTNFIYVGRLVSTKKIMLLFESFVEFIIRSGSKDSNLIIVGEGPEKAKCLKYLQLNHSNLIDRFEFKGHQSDVEVLRELYATSIASVSPGYVGLSVTQSFAFGVPMIISQDEEHSPEIESVQYGANALYFETDNKNDLADKIHAMYNSGVVLELDGEGIVDNCRKNYSSDVMARRIALALNLETSYSPDNRKPLLINAVRGYVRIYRKLKLRLKMGSKLKFGTNVYFGKNCSIQSPNFFSVGNNFSAGEGLLVQTNVDAGDDCLISSNVAIVGNDHNFDNELSSNFWSGKESPSTVTLEGNNFIGYGVKIIGNINIGEGALIGAGSVVINDVSPNTVVAGVPARVIRLIK